MMNPPSTKINRMDKTPSALATTMVLPVAPINRKRGKAIWWIAKNAKNCRKNLITKTTCLRPIQGIISYK